MTTILTLIFLLLAIPSWAMSPCMLGAGGGATVTWSCADADIICESFDASDDGYDLTWTETESNGTLTPKTSHSGTLGGQKGAYCIEGSDSSGVATGSGFAYTDGGAQAVSYTQFYFNHTNALGANGRATYIARADTTTSFSNSAWTIYFTRVSDGNYKVQLQFYDGGSWRLYDSSQTNLSVNTWYGVRVYYVPNNANGISWQIQYNVAVDSWTSESNAVTQTAARTPRYWGFGVIGGSNVAETPTVQIDMVKVDKDAYPASTAP